MIRHYRDYCFDKTQADRPIGQQEGRTLCGKDLAPLLVSDVETLAFAWCPPEKVACEACRAGRVRLEGEGLWPYREDRDGVL